MDAAKVPCCPHQHPKRMESVSFLTFPRKVGGQKQTWSPPQCFLAPTVPISDYCYGLGSLFKDNILLPRQIPHLHAEPSHPVLNSYFHPSFRSFIIFFFSFPLQIESKYFIILHSSPLSPFCCLLPLFSFQISKCLFSLPPPFCSQLISH